MRLTAEGDTPVRIEARIGGALPRVRGARVLVRQDVQADEIGGVIVPELAKEEQYTGVVLLVGDAVSDLNPGDRVQWGQYSGADLVYAGAPAKLLRADDIVMVLAPEAANGEGQ